MNDLNEIKEELARLVFANKKDEALKLLQEKYGVSPEEAEKLLKLALKDAITPDKIFKRVSQTIEIFGARGCKNALFKLIAITFGGLGVPVLLIAAFMCFYYNYHIQNSDLVLGTVTAMKEYKNYGEPSDYTPIITYQIGIEQYNLSAPVYSDTPEFEVGEKVDLFVRKNDPENVLIDTFTQRWIMPIVVGSFGFAFVVIALFSNYMSRRSV